MSRKRDKPEHPDFKMWENYHQFGSERGKLVLSILSSRIDIRGKRILDVGCGYGAISEVLAQAGSEVFSVEIDFQKICRLNKNRISPVLMSGTALGFRNESYDIAILQDVIEHIPEPGNLIAEIKRVLKPDGLLYLVTPNRLSPFNILSDPHWNLPLVAIASRRWVHFLVKKIFRRENLERNDFAVLLSWFQLNQIFQRHRIKMNFVHSYVVQALFLNPAAVVCHPFHLKIAKWLKKYHFQSLIKKCVNDKTGVFNRFINPTWYIIGQVS